MKVALIAIAVLVFTGVVAFVVMGIQSRGGSPPGMSASRLKPCGSRPNCVSNSAPSDSPNYVAGFTVRPGAEDAAWTDLIKAIGATGGNLAQNSPPNLSATFTSKIFGFVDDFECLIDRDAGVIHVRSSARVGYSDRNVNRARVERIREMLNAPKGV